MNPSSSFLIRFLFLINLSIFLIASYRFYSENRAKSATQGAVIHFTSSKSS